jgi:hypothetical protein
MPGRKLSVALVGLRYNDYYRHTLSLGYLKSYVASLASLKDSIDTALLEHSVFEEPADLTRSILDREPDAVGFSCYLWNMDRVSELCRSLKRERPGLRIVLGGPDVSVRAAEMLERLPEADVVVRGEGEATFAELLGAWTESRSIEGLAGLTYRAGGRIVNNPERPLLDDLSVVPSPYLDGTFDIRPGDSLALETSRGCPLQCRFCDWQNFQATRWFPEERAVREVQAVNKMTGGSAFFNVTDADLFTDKPRALRLLEAFDLATGATSVKWHFQTYLGNIDAELAGRLDSYKFTLGAGIETIQPRALKRMVRGMGRRSVEKAIGHLHRRGPQCTLLLQIIHGLPDDDLTGYRRTLEWSLSMQPAGLFLPRCLALPGAEFGKHPEQYGIVEIEQTPPYQVLATETFSKADVDEAEKLALRVHHTHKIGVMRKALGRLAPAGLSEAPETAAETPWVDLYERFYVYMSERSDFYRRSADWIGSAGHLRRVMTYDPPSWMALDPAAQLEVVLQAAQFAKEELRSSGRTAEWPALLRYFRAFEARLLWDRALHEGLFRGEMASLFEGLQGKSTLLARWESLSPDREERLLGEPEMAHLLSPATHDMMFVCGEKRTRHIHLADRDKLEQWDGVLEDGPFKAAVLSNIYLAIPASLRVSFLRLLKDRLKGTSPSLLLWTDGLSLTDVELPGADEADAPSLPALKERVLGDLKKAGWSPTQEPFDLTLPSSFGGNVAWSFFRAVPARRRSHPRQRPSAEAPAR